MQSVRMIGWRKTNHERNLQKLRTLQADIQELLLRPGQGKEDEVAGYMREMGEEKELNMRSDALECP